MYNTTVLNMSSNTHILWRNVSDTAYTWNKSKNMMVLGSFNEESKNKNMHSSSSIHHYKFRASRYRNRYTAAINSLPCGKLITHRSLVDIDTNLVGKKLDNIWVACFCSPVKSSLKKSKYTSTKTMWICLLPIISFIFRPPIKKS